MSRPVIRDFPELTHSIRQQELTRKGRGGTFLLESDGAYMPVTIFHDPVRQVLSAHYLDAHVEHFPVEMLFKSRLGLALRDGTLSGPSPA